MAIRKPLKVAVALLVITAGAAATAVVLIPRLVNLENYRAEIISTAEQALHRRVSYRSASFSWNLIPSITFRGITITEKSGAAVFAEIEELRLKLALLPLIHNEVRLKELAI